MRTVIPFLLLCMACGDRDSGTASSATPEVPTETEESTETATMPSSPQGNAGTSPRRDHAAAARLLRAGRAAVREENWETATEKFDALLSAVPDAPRFWCEAGFVSLRQQRFDEAARRLDRGIALFGPVHRVTEELRPALAMCFYNRGRVEEDRVDPDSMIGPDAAVHYYETSLYLRDNRAVRERFELASTYDQPARALTANISGVEVDQHGLFRTNRPSQIEDALELDLRGYREFDGVFAESANAEAAGMEVVPGGSAFVFTLNDNASPVSMVHLLIALPAQGGSRVVDAELGLMDDDGERSSIEVRDVETTAAHGLFRVDFTVEVSSYYYDQVEVDGLTCVTDGHFPDRIEHRSIVCTTDMTQNCVSLVRGVTQPDDFDLWLTCENEQGGFVDPPATVDPTAPEDYETYLLAVDLLQGGKLQLRVESGEPPSESADWIERPVTVRHWQEEGPHEPLKFVVPYLPDYED